MLRIQAKFNKFSIGTISVRDFNKPKKKDFIDDDRQVFDQFLEHLELWGKQSGYSKYLLMTYFDTHNYYLT